MRRGALLATLCLLISGCGSASLVRASHPAASGGRTGGIPHSLLAGARPIGRGPRFQPAVTGRVPGRCTRPLGRRLQVHIEIFGANHVVLLPAGIGVGGPRRMSDGRILHAGCFGDMVTLDPTGTVYLRPGERLTVGGLFRAWGQVLSARRIASFTGGHVRAYVNGRSWQGPARAIALTPRSEIVLEVGPRVPPHSRFTFPRPPTVWLR